MEENYHFHYQIIELFYLEIKTKTKAHLNTFTFKKGENGKHL